MKAAVRRLPYALRYLVAVTAWSGIVLSDLFLRFGFVFVIPIVCLMPPSQMKAQTLANVADFLIHPLMRFPKADWRRLFGLSPRYGTGYRALLD